MTIATSPTTSPREPHHAESFAYRLPSTHTGTPVCLGSDARSEFWAWFHVTGARPQDKVLCVATADAGHVSGPIRHINLAIHTFIGTDEVRYLTDAPSIFDQTSAARPFRRDLPGPLALTLLRLIDPDTHYELGNKNHVRVARLSSILAGLRLAHDEHDRAHWRASRSWSHDCADPLCSAFADVLYYRKRLSDAPLHLDDTQSALAERMRLAGGSTPAEIWAALEIISTPV